MLMLLPVLPILTGEERVVEEDATVPVVFNAAPLALFIGRCSLAQRIELNLIFFLSIFFPLTIILHRLHPNEHGEIFFKHYLSYWDIQ